MHSFSSLELMMHSNLFCLPRMLTLAGSTLRLRISRLVQLCMLSAYCSLSPSSRELKSAVLKSMHRLVTLSIATIVVSFLLLTILSVRSRSMLLLSVSLVLLVDFLPPRLLPSRNGTGLLLMLMLSRRVGTVVSITSSTTI